MPPRGVTVVVNGVNDEKRLIVLLSRRRCVCHRPWCNVTTSNRPCMSLDELLAFSDFSLILHDHATATAERLHAIST